MILVDYDITSRDLVNLDRTCKWFKFSWGGGSVTEEAARNILKKYKRKRFGALVNRVSGKSWKERLQNLEGIEFRQPTLAAGSYQNIYLREPDHLLTWGAGRFGQLGNNDREDSTAQNIARYIPQEAGKVVQVSAGCGHTGFVTDKGHAFTCGDNRYGQLGHTDFSGRTCKLPQKVHRGLPEGERCVQIACGSVHTILLMDSGHMYVTGLGDSGQLGLGMEKSALVFTLIPFQYEEYNIVSVTAGIAHNIILTDCGKVFTFGLGSLGQLGHGGTKNLFQPTQVSVLRDKRVVFAAAGVCHSIFLDASGAVYTCGKGLGLLGHGDTGIRTVPSLVKSLQGVCVVRAAAGVARSIFISREGVGYWCGEGSGELQNVREQL
jgi:alpha-tubulin suppressor-like RCC1 family protein